MSLNRIEVFNYQSLRHVDLELGNFTVIVGPSSSGKSALMRAFKALASNVRGSGVITRGQKALAITARTDTHTITLERTERSGTYKLSNSVDLTQITFTKLAGEVPEQITAALRIDPVGEGGSVNFASQFDKPYLLDESGATVARVLGELTNVTAVFEAVRAANRIRASAASTLKTRKGDLEQVTARLGAFAGLSERMRLLGETTQLDDRRQKLEHRIGRLESALRTLKITERAIERAVVPEVPDGSRLAATMRRYLDLNAALRLQDAKCRRLGEADTALLLASNAVEQLETDLHEALDAAGVCPTCGQKIGGWFSRPGILPCGQRIAP
jgi:DNA repair protein SbcC/Rad50